MTSSTSITSCKATAKYTFFAVLCVSSVSLWIISFTPYGVLPVYGFIMSFYFVMQIFTCCLNRYATKDPSHATSTPRVSILVVGYREDPVMWTNCLLSLRKQIYPSITEIVVSIDGDEEGDDAMRTIAIDILCRSSIPYCIIMNPHGGKRSAMHGGFTHILSSDPLPPEYILVTDSDTVFEQDATTAMVSCIDSDPQNGCATGTLRVFSTHFLGRIVNARYAYAFNIERASMSYFGVMNCCSGPLSIYRSSLLDESTLESFLHQDCCGERCGPGDDRHLTCLMLMKGYKARHTHYAEASTEAPPTLEKFIVQQSRWIRSFYREIPWQVRAIGNQHIVLALVTHFELIYPYLVIMWISYALVNHMHIIRGALIATSIIMLRTLILFALHQCDPRMLLNAFYLPLYFTCILPLKMVGIITIREMNWAAQTRDGSIIKRRPILPFAAIVMWNVFMLGAIIRFIVHSYQSHEILYFAPL